MKGQSIGYWAGETTAEHGDLTKLSLPPLPERLDEEFRVPDVAMTLNNLAVLYRDTQRMKEAEAACREAEGILESLWFVNPRPGTAEGLPSARTMGRMRRAEEQRSGGECERAQYSSGKQR